jgi:hypothetical protein
VAFWHQGPLEAGKLPVLAGAKCQCKLEFSNGDMPPWYGPCIERSSQCERRNSQDASRFSQLAKPPQSEFATKLATYHRESLPIALSAEYI